jgi:hypothetical protein
VKSPTEILNCLPEVTHVSYEVTESDEVIISNLLQEFQVRLELDEMEDCRFVVSPYGDKCLQINIFDRFVIIAPDDFVFQIIQDEQIKVDNLPPLCSIQEMQDGFSSYLSCRGKNENMDIECGNFFFQYYLVKNAVKSGIELPEYIIELYKIGKEEEFWGLGPLKLFAKLK